jgi:hypothetical protein
MKTYYGNTKETGNIVPMDPPTVELLLEENEGQLGGIYMVIWK